MQLHTYTVKREMLENKEYLCSSFFLNTTDPLLSERERERQSVMGSMSVSNVRGEKATYSMKRKYIKISLQRERDRYRKKEPAGETPGVIRECRNRQKT